MDSLSALLRCTSLVVSVLAAVLMAVPTPVSAEKLLENFQDPRDWQPEFALGWWDIDGPGVVYQRDQVFDPTFGSTVMRVRYNKTGHPWSLFGGSIAPVNPRRNFTSYNTVRVRVGSGVHERVLLKLRDAKGVERDVQYKVLGASRDGSPLAIDFNYAPLASAGIALTQVNNLLFFLAPGSTVGLTSEKRIDDIKLVNSVILDNLETYPNATCGTVWFDNAPGTTPILQRQIVAISNPPTTPDSDFAAEGNRYMEVATPGWSFGALMGSACRNFERYRNLSFWIRKRMGSSFTLSVQLEGPLYDNSARWKSVAQAITVDSPYWTRVDLLLENFYKNAPGPLHMAEVQNVVFYISGLTGNTRFNLDDLTLSE